MKSRYIITSAILWGYVAAVMFLILFDFSDINMSEVPTTILGVPTDKIAHFLMFLSFPIIIGIYRIYHRRIKLLQHNIVILTLGVAFAITTELLQLSLTSYREFDMYDIVADICGIIIGLIIIKIKLPTWATLRNRSEH